MTKPEGSLPIPEKIAGVTEKRTSWAQTKWAWTLATFFGTGFLRPGPGTWGSVAALLLWLAAAHWGHVSTGQLSIVTLVAAVLATLIGIPAASIVQRESGKDDPGFVVLDEVAGQWIALAAATARWQEWLLAFLLFRVFDILKPTPARQLDRMHSGFGIMMDDVAAGVYAMLVVWLLRHWL
ncbi:MAG TPA: phosphatidylglycerophosphatase A [Acidobacteriaceae bacterium]|jgi:phosphatidylglycerophosphatase A|nr:phosphatidylglycerophosphatase A [Acidobacteriaceae bacterium]